MENYNPETITSINLCKLQLGSDSISSFGGSINLDQNILNCSLCFCINFNCKQCKNKKCNKLFCDLCYKVNKEKNKNFQCPFCRDFNDCITPEKSIFDAIDSLRFYCPKSLTCNESYTINDYYINHLHKENNNQNKKCVVCKFNFSISNPNFLKCNICYEYGCFFNTSKNILNDENNMLFSKEKEKEIKNKHCLTRCFSCHSAICSNCNKKNNFIKNNSENNYYILNNNDDDDENTEKFNDFICENCNSSCFYCFSNNAKKICKFCKRIICDSCYSKCSNCNFITCKNQKCLESIIAKCQKCQENYGRINYYTCNHKILFESCNNCFPKCKICLTNIYDNICYVCSRKICILTCSIMCKLCNNIICSECSTLCNVCKKIICKKCIKFCDECGENDLSSLNICKKCSKNVFKKCSYVNCNKTLCINCWKICNYCNIVICQKHSNICTNCEENMCVDHFHTCEKCSDKDELEYKKLCLKRCTLKCNFCNNVTNVLCKEKSHMDDMVKNYGCKHDVCLSCVKKCYRCNKILIPCINCMPNYYNVNCKFCGKYSCNNNSCSAFCNKCSENYCNNLHTCFCCQKVNNPSCCINCLYKNRFTCIKCEKNIKICNLCKMKFICSLRCYIEFLKWRNKLKLKIHICNMFYCDKHIIEKI